uniref:Uncharacterized protein LOC114345914 n=1 Tax=Diabrotica virgifera virgifera TaxID=50390 RepID=A0A6P7H4B6_DIAVI
MKGLLGGAAQVIRSIEFSASNYTVAWETLLNRYNNDNLLIHNHVKAIFDIPNIQQESAAELRQMLDSLSKHLRSLQNLNQPTEHWDTLLIYILSNKLDKTTAREWEESKVKCESQTSSNNKSVPPTLEEFASFIRKRADLLETLSLAKETKGNKSRVSYHNQAGENQGKDNIKQVSCIYCKQSQHFIQGCPEFLNLSVEQRTQAVNKHHLCVNCLRNNHNVRRCFAGPCRKCGQRHNTLLHVDKTNTSVNHVSSVSNVPHHSSQVINESIPLQTLSYCQKSSEPKVLLSTVLVNVEDRFGNLQMCRVLLDSGSQSNFITSDTVKKLGLTTSRVDISVTGINQITSIINRKCQVTIKSTQNSFYLNLTCLVVPKINESLPNHPIDTSAWNIPSNVVLADPTFDQVTNVDMLIGAEYFYSLISIGQIKLGKGLPVLQKTVFGWVVSGPVHTGQTQNVHCHLSTSDTDEDIHNCI